MSKKVAKIYIYGELAPWAVNAQDIAEKIQEYVNDGFTHFNIYINSPGGSVFEGIGIYNELKALDNVKVIITGMAASAASFIAMASDSVEIIDNAFFLIHNPWTWAAGDAKYMEKVQGELEMIQDTLVQGYVDKTGQDEQTIRDWMDDDKLWKANLAKDRGFVDRIVKPGKMAKYLNYIGIITPQMKEYKGVLMNNLKLKLIALFGLTLTVEDSEQSFINAVEAKMVELNKDLNTATTGKTTAETKLAQSEKDLKTTQESLKTFVDADINKVLDAAVSRGAITADEKPVWDKTLREDFDGTKAILDAKKGSTLAKPVVPPNPDKKNQSATGAAAEIIRTQMGTQPK